MNNSHEVVFIKVSTGNSFFIFNYSPPDFDSEYYVDFFKILCDILAHNVNCKLLVGHFNVPGYLRSSDQGCSNAVDQHNIVNYRDAAKLLTDVSRSAIYFILTIILTPELFC